MNEDSHLHGNNDLRQRTKDFALLSIRIYKELPFDHEEVRVCGRQFIRSATSVAANYREAFRARSRAEYISKLETCIQEADETMLWLELLNEGCDVQLKSIPAVWQEANELIAIMVTLAKKAKE